MTDTFIDRMEREHAELDARIVKLKLFVNNPDGDFSKLSVMDKMLLELQLDHMQAYYSVLNSRLVLAKHNNPGVG